MLRGIGLGAKIGSESPLKYYFRLNTTHQSATSRSIGFPRGNSLECDELVESNNNNDGAYLKAALRHLLH
jgi:hypothetical protein